MHVVDAGGLGEMAQFTSSRAALSDDVEKHQAFAPRFADGSRGSWTAFSWQRSELFSPLCLRITNHVATAGGRLDDNH